MTPAPIIIRYEPVLEWDSAGWTECGDLRATTYIIDALRIPHTYATARPGDWALPSFARAEQYQYGTYATLADAEAAYAVLAQTPSCLAAALVEWAAPGPLGSDRLPLTYGARSTAGGVPVQRLLRHGDRTWHQYSGASGIVSYTDDDWRDYDGDNADLTTQPAPGFRLRARS